MKIIKILLTTIALVNFAYEAQPMVPAQDRPFGSAQDRQKKDANQKVIHDRLITAIHTANIKLAQQLLNDKSIDINAKGEFGNTALSLASSLGEKEIVKLLLDHGANINIKDKDSETALQAASAHGHKEIVELLLDYGADVNIQTDNGETALMFGVRNSNKEVVELLLDRGANINIKNIWNNSALTYVSDVEVLKLLLDDPDINIQKKDYDHSDTTIRLYLEKYRDKYLKSRDKYYYKKRLNEINEALQSSLPKELIGIVQQYSANNFVTFSKFLELEEKIERLLDAVNEGDIKTVQELLKDKSIDINAKDEHGRTALLSASHSGHKEIVELLLNHPNIDVNIQDPIGRTVFDYASEYGHEAIAKLLENYRNKRKDQPKSEESKLEQNKKQKK